MGRSRATSLMRIKDMARHVLLRSCGRQVLPTGAAHRTCGTGEWRCGQVRCRTVGCAVCSARSTQWVLHAVGVRPAGRNGVTSHRGAYGERHQRQFQGGEEPAT
jgi:hypothetical protein